MAPTERFIKLLVVTGCIQFVGCTTNQAVQPGTNVPVEERSIPVYENGGIVEIPAPGEFETGPDISDMAIEPSGEKPQPTGTAIVALLEDADHYASSGKQDQAAASLERALRIEPKNPLLWQRLGLIRLQQGQWQQAIALAQKSNSLSKNDKRLQLNNWRIIARASDAAGDKEGTRKAEEMIELLE